MGRWGDGEMGRWGDGEMETLLTSHSTLNTAKAPELLTSPSTIAIAATEI
ncbi:MAG: hypothetical protein KME17_12740 [Cyanosarcina radialis HA8281-LM2]|jgi:predicted transport protein|nr:hypothetical protein [Cyanosarcina radialis HA8281-LM2]